MVAVVALWSVLSLVVGFMAGYFVHEARWDSHNEHMMDRAEQMIDRLGK